jgi:hypothetical protein
MVAGTGYGTFYGLTPGTNPLVVVQTRSGNAGTTVNILGQGFNGTTKVAFHGIVTTFTVVSDTFMTATIPSGAKTGYVTVTTPGGVLQSLEKFRAIH